MVHAARHCLSKVIGYLQGVLRPFRLVPKIFLLTVNMSTGYHVLTMTDHNKITMMDAVFNLCDRAVVLDYGKRIAEGIPKEIAQNKAVVEAYLGAPLT